MYTLENTEIKTEELRLDYIKEVHLKKLKRNILGIKSDALYIVLFLMILIFIFSFLFFISIKNNLTKETIFALIFDIMFIILEIYFIKKYLKIGFKKIKKSQYGFVKNKYKIISSHSDNSHYNYYITALFPEQKKYILQVICSKKDFDSANIGDDVLVFSFDNKKPYCVLLKK